MKYDNVLIHLGSDEFEELVIGICQEILGIGTFSFAQGPDGGKDGRFTGMAKKYPSEVMPWNGTMIIQAKHTTSPIAKCSDGEFFKNESSIINKEITKLNKILSNEKLDYYLLFTNRKYSGGNDCKILKHISSKTSIPINNIAVIGIETMNSLISPALSRRFNLDKFRFNFDFSDAEIKEIILAFKKQLPGIKSQISAEARKYDFSRIDMVEKNKKNKLRKEYYENVMLSNSLMMFDNLQHFLENPMNAELKEYYYDTVNELNQIITVKRDNFVFFEELFVFIYQKISEGNISLLGAKRHITTFLHYMYFNCEIGNR